MKVKVRIAVGISHDGEWEAYGASYIRDFRAINSVEDSARKHCYWIEAELDVPEVKTVHGDVVSHNEN